jgi:hypothetical protein
MFSAGFNTVSSKYPPSSYPPASRRAISCSPVRCATFWIPLSRSITLRCLRVAPGESNPRNQRKGKREVKVTFCPRFKRIWLESRKHLPEYMERGPANTALRSQCCLPALNWAKKYVADGAKTVSLEEFRRVFGLESIKDAEGNVIQEAPLPVWANFQGTDAQCRACAN